MAGPIAKDLDGITMSEVRRGRKADRRRHNVPRIGRVLIARGRDAADVAISTTFGNNVLRSFKVWTEAVL